MLIAGYMHRENLQKLTLQVINKVVKKKKAESILAIV